MDSALGRAAHTVHEMIGVMWWGIILAIFVIGVLDQIPQEFIVALLGKPGTTRGILRAAVAGVLLDLCSHGILMVGAKLYQRGASAGQVMAFLIASPWNSLSLTIILWALVEGKSGTNHKPQRNDIRYFNYFQSSGYYP